MRPMLLALLLVLAAAAPAAGRPPMEVGMQDDQTVVYGYHNRALALKQFKAMGGTNVRIIVEHKRNSNYDDDISAKATKTQIKHYDDAIAAINDAGLTPQLTLNWGGATDPILIGGWMHNVAARYADSVKRFSILNEPDLFLHVRGACDKAGERSFIRRHPTRTFVYRGERRAYDPTLPHGFKLHIACLREARGLAYREVVDWAEQSIHEAAPRAQVLAGETSAQVGLEWFIHAARPRRMQHITGWAHHPYQLHDLTPHIAAHNYGIGNIARVKRLVGMPLYMTEFGYPHPRSSMDRRVFGRPLRQKDLAKVLPRAWRIARRAGVRQMLQYQWFVKPKWRHEYWETALLDRDNGKTTLAYRALRSLILGWRR